MACSIIALIHLFFSLLSQHWLETGSSYRSLFGFFLLGLSYSVYTSAAWPCIPYIVDRKILGRSYGIMVCLENLGLTLGPILVGLMLKTTYEEGYFAVSLLNFFEAVGATIFSCLLFHYDITHNRILLANDEDARRIQKVQNRHATKPLENVKADSKAELAEKNDLIGS